VAAVVLLGAFALIEARSRHALVPPRALASRDRTAARLISLCTGTAVFGMFFFMTIFVQQVWGYSPVRSGIAYLPMVAAIMAGAGASSQLVARVGARPLMTAGPLFAAVGLFWLSRISEASTYAGGLPRPLMLTGLGMGLTFVPLSLVALAKVPNKDTRGGGVAAEHRAAGRRVDRPGDPRHGGLAGGGVMQVLAARNAATCSLAWGQQQPASTHETVTPTATQAMAGCGSPVRSAGRRSVRPVENVAGRAAEEPLFLGP
jgi:hypothetical protein